MVFKDFTMSVYFNTNQNLKLRFLSNSLINIKDKTTINDYYYSSDENNLNEIEEKLQNDIDINTDTNLEEDISYN